MLSEKINVTIKPLRAGKKKCQPIFEKILVEEDFLGIPLVLSVFEKLSTASVILRCFNQHPLTDTHLSLVPHKDVLF